MKLLEVMENTGFTFVKGYRRGLDEEIKGIAKDLKDVTEGCLFVCIRGLMFDGHSLISDAVKNGAVAVMIDNAQDEYPDVNVVKVDNTRIGLSYAASNFFGKPTEGMNLVGVTGTKGKTSTTFYIEEILKTTGEKVGVIGTAGARVGDDKINIAYQTATTPDSIELQRIFAMMCERGCKYVVMEVSSHALELRKVDGLKYDVGIFTNLDRDHLEFHGTMDNYRDAKAKLFSLCSHGVINADDKAAEFLVNRYKEGYYKGSYSTFGIDNESGLKAFDIEYSGSGTGFKAIVNGRAEQFFIGVPGRFTVYNALASIVAGLNLGLTVDMIRRGMANIKGVPGRFQSVPNDRGFNVIVDFAHTPNSIEGIILAVKDFTKGRVITVFGCGGDKDRTKRPIMGDLSARLSDYTILTSDNPRTENPDGIIDEIEAGVNAAGLSLESGGYERITDRRSAIERAISMAKQGDSVIIAGKGDEDYQILADRTIHFSDVEEVERCIR